MFDRDGSGRRPAGGRHRRLRDRKRDRFNRRGQPRSIGILAGLTWQRRRTGGSTGTRASDDRTVTGHTVGRSAQQDKLIRDHHSPDYMNDRYDVVIAGAGPAGAQCARDLAARGYDVVVLETESESEFPRQSNKSTAGTFHSMMAAFGIPDDVVMQYTDSVVLESPREHFVRDQTGAVLEFADFKRYLVEDGRETGAEYRFDARVTAPIMEGGEIAGVRYNGDKEVYGDIVVDATGPSAPLAKQLDVVDLKRENHAI